jgi:periplasmic divalent cation tolerance protein
MMTGQNQGKSNEENPMSEPEVWQVVTTTDTEDEAATLAAGLIDRHLAACVQVDGPIRSTYRWEGKATTDPEWRLTIKTTAERYPAMAAWLIEQHSYDVPELLATKVVTGNVDYIGWVSDEIDDVKV